MATRCAAIWFVSPNLVYDPVENVSNSFEKDISKKFPSLFVIVDKQGRGNDELRWSVDNSYKKSQTWKSEVVLNKVISINQTSQNITNRHSHESSSSKYSKCILIAMPWGMAIWYTQSIFGYLYGYPGLCSELFLKEPQPIRTTNNFLDMFWILIKRLKQEGKIWQKIVHVCGHQLSTTTVMLYLKPHWLIA